MPEQAEKAGGAGAKAVPVLRIRGENGEWNRYLNVKGILKNASKRVKKISK